MYFLEYIPHFLKISTMFIIFLLYDCLKPVLHPWNSFMHDFICSFFSLCFLLLFCSFWLIYLFIFKIYFLSFVNISTSFYISRNRQTIFSVNVSWIGEDLSPMFTLVLAIQVLHQVPSHTSWDPQSRCYCSLGVGLRLGLHFCCSL